MTTSSGSQQEKKLEWWQLSLLGVACTVGTGFFLGSSIAISMAGPSVILAYALAAIGTYFVYEALAKLTIADPQEGSFRIYAKKAYGRWAGFSCGWVYWLSELLIMGSQLTALSIFTRFWFPHIPLWIFACGYSVLAIIVILTGAKGFDRVENLLAVLKIAAVVMFIVLAGVALFGFFGDGVETAPIPRTMGGFMPNGITGLLPALIFGFYGFAGIEIIGLLAIRLKNMEDAMKTGKVMFALLAFLYITSISLALILMNWDQFTTDKSPFVSALREYAIPYIPHIFNGVFIIAGFSTMVASLFAMIRILVSLANDHDAPFVLGKMTKKETPLPAIGVTAGAIIVSIVLSLLLPDRIYEYFTTAAGLMLLYNWYFIIGSSNRLLEITTGDKVKRIIGFIIVMTAIVGTAFHSISRPGFYVSLLFVVIIALITWIMVRIWKKNQSGKDPGPGSIFTKIKQ
ncbi:amino acid permease [Bacillus shivajii]|uniref:amino acid permease n=1 Tax=Bacillus shivajii TaxID=1983719 RepID=UPI001CFA57BA|nr:amino acid permease [Bacillus shivajii]UCZ53612.1 amino acid permease [Bacillus shivajii]